MATTIGQDARCALNAAFSINTNYKLFEKITQFPVFLYVTKILLFLYVSRPSFCFKMAAAVGVNAKSISLEQQNKMHISALHVFPTRIVRWQILQKKITLNRLPCCLKMADRFCKSFPLRINVVFLFKAWMTNTHNIIQVFTYSHIWYRPKLCKKGKKSVESLIKPQLDANFFSNCCIITPF